MLTRERDWERSSVLSNNRELKLGRMRVRKCYWNELASVQTRWLWMPYLVQCFALVWILVWVFHTAPHVSRDLVLEADEGIKGTLKPIITSKDEFWALVICDGGFIEMLWLQEWACSLSLSASWHTVWSSPSISRLCLTVQSCEPTSSFFLYK